jgi:aspartate/methionine/tyrosine aminotransferase
MQVPRIDIFEWLLHNAPRARYNLAFSNINGVTVEEFKECTQFSLPDDFDLGVNAQYGADELKRTLGLFYHCKPSNIVTTTGASEANFLVFSSLFDQGDEFIVEQPGYQPLWSTPEMLGARRINWPRMFDHRFGVDLETLNNLITEKTKLIIMTNLHNPSGVFTDQELIKEIAQIAAEHHAYVLIDEIFLDGSFLRRASSYGISNVIVTSSTTKIYGFGGFHTGWIIAPSEIAIKCQQLKAHSTGASSYISEVVSAHILSESREYLLTRFQRRAKTNFDIIKKWISEHAEFFEWVEPDGGLMCFPKYSLDISSLELCNYLFDTEQLLINPGIFFNQEGFLRISYYCDEQSLQSALDALERGLQNLQNR